jgi:hypothetical protein
MWSARKTASEASSQSKVSETTVRGKPGNGPIPLNESQPDNRKVSIESKVPENTGFRGKPGENVSQVPKLTFPPGIAQANPRGCLKPDNGSGNTGASSSCGVAPNEPDLDMGGDPSDPGDDPDPDPDGDGPEEWEEEDDYDEEEEEEWSSNGNSQIRATKMLCKAMQSIAGRGTPRDNSKVRKEADKVELGNLPDAANLWKWEMYTAKALARASAYADEAEVKWFKEIRKDSVTFASLSESGDSRYKSLDQKLAHAMHEITSKAGSRGHVLYQRFVHEERTRFTAGEPMLTGRQCVKLMCDFLQTNSSLRPANNLTAINFSIPEIKPWRSS